jgi:hypothetical protein
MQKCRNAEIRFATSLFCYFATYFTIFLYTFSNNNSTTA